MDTEERTPIIVVKNLTARFGDNVVFEDLNFQVYKGEILVKEGLKSGFAMIIEIPLTQHTENE